MRNLFLIFVLVVFIISCASTKEVETPPEEPLVKVSEFVYCKAVSDTSKKVFVKHISGAGKVGQVLAYSILAVDGVQNIYPSNYEFTIIIPDCFNWDEVMPKVYEVINNHIRDYEALKEKADPEPAGEGV
jgi:hypothetical protein